MLTHWRGLLLGAVGIAATCSLAVTGRLDWYIHPRYIVFTVTMAVLGGVLAVIAAGVLLTERRRARAGSRGDAAAGLATESAAAGAGSGPGAGSAVGRSAVIGSVALVVVTAVALLVLPPATLTSATAGQRVVNASVTGSEAGDLSAALQSGDDGELGVKEWSLLLRQDGGEEAIGRSADLVGFITPDPDSPEEMFYVSRFSVTCCTIDAQPVGVPVHAPGWQDEFEADAWVRVSGAFASNPDASDDRTVVLMPADLVGTEMPEDPYVH